MSIKTFQQSISQHSFYTIINRKIFTCLFNNKSLKSHLDYSKVPKLKEEDLEIQYVRGSGPGGQSTNKTSNAVVMKHIPTGIVVKCHETRSQFTNKEIAQERLIDKLDKHFNGEDAIENQEKRYLQKKSKKIDSKQKKRAAMKAAFKERENLD